MIQRHTVGVVGSGNVGVAAAYALLVRDTASSIVLVDMDTKRAEGEALDLMHGQGFSHPVNVRAGAYEDLAEAQVVVVTAGSARKAGESRLDLLNRNAAILQSITENLDRCAPEAVIVMVTNPVDITTYIVQHYSKRPAARIMGTGTMLDVTRFRAILGRHYNVNPHSVNAFILGEHGDSQVPIWSCAEIGGQRIADNVVLGKFFDRDAMNTFFEQVRYGGREVIARKGHTNLAIGLVIASLVETILDDERSVLPVSVRLDGEYGVRGVCMSIPCVVGSEGIQGRILPKLNDEELAAMTRSAAVLQENLNEVKLS